MSMRGNRPVPKAKIVKDRFIEAMKAKGLTIKALGKLSENDRDRSEKTIWRYISCGEMPFDLLDRLAERLDVHQDFLMGKYDMPASLEIEEELRKRMQSFVTPQRYPYALKAIRTVKVDQYYTALLAIHGLSLDQFIRLAPEQRFAFQHEIENALVPILLKYFPRDVVGEDGYPNFYAFDSQIDSVEDDYDRFGLDYWKEPDYHQKIAEMEDEQLTNWE